jgi:hypothetical protein
MSFPRPTASFRPRQKVDKFFHRVERNWDVRGYFSPLPEFTIPKVNLHNNLNGQHEATVKARMDPILRPKGKIGAPCRRDPKANWLACLR